MAPPPRVVLTFAELRKADTEIAGGKGANLGELSAAGLPVPAGFVVTAQAYLRALDDAGIRGTLVDIAARLDASDAQSLERESARLQQLVSSASVPVAVAHAVLEAYRALGEDVRVAVRSSATMEDTAGTSFAGMNETYTNVSGETDLLQAIVRCWASVWGKRVIAYRKGQGLDQEPAIRASACSATATV